MPALTLAVRDQPLRRSFGLGYLFGLGMLTVAVSWLHVLGVWVAALLIVFEALFFGAARARCSAWSAGCGWWPLAAACCWVLVEYAYSRIPFGGFGWTRIAYAAVDTPLAGFLPFIGVAGLSFVVALVAQLIAWLRDQPAGRAGRAGRGRGCGRCCWPVGGCWSPLVAVPTGLRGYQVEPADGGRAVGVGIVQGNIPGRGIEAMGRARSVTNNHLSETVDLMTRVRLGPGRQPDFLLWPENSTDIDPTVDPVTRLTVDAAAEVAGRPILVGAVMQGPGEGERQTTRPVVGAGARSAGPVRQANLVPFGEWIPFRDQLLPLVPILEQVGAQSVPGHRARGAGGRGRRPRLTVGDVICFELAYDQTVYEAVRGGREVLMVQSNNATYGGTGQIEQQFAITRARAMEARREVAVATTNSVSGFIDRDGRVVQRTSRVHRRQHGGPDAAALRAHPAHPRSRPGWTVVWPRSGWAAAWPAFVRAPPCPARPAARRRR